MSSLEEDVRPSGLTIEEEIEAAWRKRAEDLAAQRIAARTKDRRKFSNKRGGRKRSKQNSS